MQHMWIELTEVLLVVLDQVLARPLKYGLQYFFQRSLLDS
jgi:hypothetical protein